MGDPALRIPFGTIVLLILAVVLYAGMMGSLVGAPHSDAAGRGMAVAFGAIFASLLFVVLALLLLVAALKGRMSLAGKIGSFVVLPAGMIAVWLAGDAWAGRDASAIWVPAFLPPLIAAYALRARFLVSRARRGGLAVELGLAALIVVLIGAPFVRISLVETPDPAVQARAAEERKARQEAQDKAVREANEREAAKFAALGPNSPMADYLPFLYGNHAREARQGIRQVRSRQQDAIALLEAGRLNELSSLLEFDVDATPELCRAYAGALGRAAAELDPRTGSNQIGKAIDLERQLPNLQWLAGERCDLAAPLGVLERNLRAVADSSRITGFADKLVKLGK